jgi:nucleoside-diphosphate-sugar epimerase
MAKYLVTGGAGFIGSHIVDALISKGENVRVLDNLSTGRKENIAHVLDKIDFIKGDITDAETVKSAVSDIDYVIHQAAIPSVPRSFKDPMESLFVNSGGTLQLLISAKENNVKCFTYASSSSVYGDKNNFQPKSPYGVSKLLGEQYCLLYNRLYGLNTVCLRYFNVFGPRQNPNSQYAAVIPKFLESLKNGIAPVIYGNGEQSRDFTFVQNVVEANLLIRKAGVYNIGCGKSTSLNVLYKMMSEMLGVNIPAKYDPPRPGDILYSCAKIDTTVYKPKVDLKEGMEHTIKQWTS